MEDYTMQLEPKAANIRCVNDPLDVYVPKEIIEEQCPLCPYLVGFNDLHHFTRHARNDDGQVEKWRHAALEKKRSNMVIPNVGGQLVSASTLINSRFRTRGHEYVNLYNYICMYVRDVSKELHQYFQWNDSAVPHNDFQKYIVYMYVHNIKNLVYTGYTEN